MKMSSFALALSLLLATPILAYADEASRDKEIC